MYQKIRGEAEEWTFPHVQRGGGKKYLPKVEKGNRESLPFAYNFLKYIYENVYVELFALPFY